jgi:hypothetical protein
MPRVLLSLNCGEARALAVLLAAALEAGSASRFVPTPEISIAI